MYNNKLGIELLDFFFYTEGMCKAFNVQKLS